MIATRPAPSSPFLGAAANVYVPSEPEAVPLAEAFVLPPLAAVNPKASSSTAPTLLDETVVHPVTQTGFRDIWMAVFFLLHLLVVLAVAGQAIGSSSSSPAHPLDPNATSSTRSLYALIALFVLIMTIAASFASSLVLVLVVSQASRVIWLMLWWNILSLGALSVLSLLSMQLLPAVFLGVLTALSYCYYHSVKDRIPFTSAVLATACAGLKDRLLTLLTTSAGVALLQAAWIAVWSAMVFAIGKRYEGYDDDLNLPGPLLALLLFSLFWTAQVISYTLYSTSSGVVACWYFQPGHPAPVRGSLFRALTTSFGSIVFAALTVAIVTTLRALLHILRRRQEEDSDRRRRRGERDAGDDLVRLVVSCFLMILEGLLRGLEDTLRYLNRYALVYVAAYGTDFLTSGKLVMDLFQRKGWTMLINDNLLSTCLTMVAALLGLVGAVTGAAVLPLLIYSGGWRAALGQDYEDTAPLAWCAIGGAAGGLIALAVGSGLVYMVDSAAAMIFVCFAEDAAMLQATHPQDYDNLVTAWLRAHPEAPIEGVASRLGGGCEGDRDVELQAYAYPYSPSISPTAPTMPHSTALSQPPPFNPSYYR